MARENQQELLRLGPFRGLDLTTDPAFVPPFNATQSINYDPGYRFGALAQTKGRTKGITGNFAAALKSIGIFERQAAVSIIGYSLQGGFGQYQIADLGAAPSGVLGFPDTGSAANTGQECRFAPYGSYIFFASNGAGAGTGDTPFKISQAAPLVLKRWGIAPPLSAPAAIQAAASGGLIGDYYYAQTYEDSTTNWESSPSPVTNKIHVESTYVGGTATFTFSGSTNLGDFFIVAVDSGGAPLNIAEQAAIPDSTVQSPVVAPNNGGFVAGLTATQVAVIAAQEINNQLSSITAVSHGAVVKVTSVGAGIEQNSLAITLSGSTIKFLSQGASPTSSPSGGTIPAGVYFPTLTLVDGAGNESPIAIYPTFVLTGTTSSISYPAISSALLGTWPGAVSYNTYLSTNGTAFHRQTTGTPVGNTVTVTTYNAAGVGPSVSATGVTVAPTSQNLTGGLSTIQDSIALTPVASTDPQVDKINFYRIGGSSAYWTFVGSVSNLTHPAFTDKLADANLTGQTLIMHRDPPPNFNAIAEHKDRMWGFGYNYPYPYTFGQVTAPPNATYGYLQTPPQASDVWFTRYAEPWAFDAVNFVIPLGRNNSGDIGVALESTGSVLVALKSKSLWVIEGSSEQDFQGIPIADIGCVNADLVASGYGMLFWVSPDKIVWRMSGASPIDISSGDEQVGGIKAALDAEQSNFMGWRSAVCNKFYLLLAPSGIVYAYYIPKGIWTTFPWSGGIAVDYEPNTNLLAVSSPTVPQAVDSWFSSYQDGYTPTVTTWVSPDCDSGDYAARKTYSYARVKIPPSDPANLIVFTFFVDGVQIHQKQFNPPALGATPKSGKSYERIAMPPSAKGHSMIVRIDMTMANSTPCVVSLVSVVGSIEEQSPP